MGIALGQAVRGTRNEMVGEARHRGEPYHELRRIGISVAEK
jgi:hypothetical protein